jgi:hypothetical protein
VNLVYAVFHQRSTPDTLLQGLFQELSIQRIEIDVIELGGPAFADQDAREWCLSLLQNEVSHAIVFDSQAQVVEPSSVLRKRPLLVMRGSFSHPELFESRLFQAANRQLLSEGQSLDRDPVSLPEITIHHASGIVNVSISEMLASIQQVAQCGSVIVTDFPETYLLGRYLRRHTVEPVRFILGVAALAKVMHETFYQTLPGTMLEGIGRLLATNVKLYVAPMPREAFYAALGDLPGNLTVNSSGSSLITLDDLVPSVPNLHLLQYLRAAGRIVALAT